MLESKKNNRVKTNGQSKYSKKKINTKKEE